MMKDIKKPVVCFFTGSAGDWGGASRVLYTSLRRLDRERIEPILLLPWDGPIVEELQRLGLRYRFWGCLTEPGKLGRYVQVFIRALLFFRRERVDLVHFNHRPWRAAEVLAARALGIPIIVHYHLVNKEGTPTDRLARAGIAVSNYVKDNSEPEALEKYVIYNPVDMERFAGGASRKIQLEIDAGKVVVTFLGQIRDFKGVQDFIAMARLVQSSEVIFLVAGECRDPREFPGSYTEKNLREMIGGDERIRYVGYVDRVEDIYVTSDIVVFPSRWQEPLGLIAIEAAACGKPVVGTRVGGIPEIIQDGVTGYLVEPGDVAALAESVERLVADPMLRHTFGEAGRKRVAEQFTSTPIRQFEDLLVRLARA